MADEKQANREKERSQDMTKEELKALGLTDEQAEAVVADYGKNYVSKTRFNTQLQSLKDEKDKVKELTEKQNDLKNKLEGFTSAGANSGADIAKLQADLKTLQQQYEDAEKARQEELNKRVQSEIMTQVVNALSEHNAVDPNTLAPLLISKVTVGDDGAYSYTDDKGNAHSIAEGAKTWLDGNAWAVKSTQRAGSGHNRENNDGGQPIGLRASIANAIGVKE
ncbi:hypothetical protein [Veillonella montpellierensis]|uniref:phage scaffolding protein n=1 Tax=Veillonella montpellierensis TaxID=187328 RepID=UPI0023F742CA|nr:hypothetical protein [Veillonella montpellierensis]